MTRTSDFSIVLATMESLGIPYDAKANEIVYQDPRVQSGPFHLVATITKNASSYDLTTDDAALYSLVAKTGAGWSADNPQLALLMQAVRVRLVQPVDSMTELAALALMSLVWTPVSGTAHYLDVPVDGGVSSLATATTADATTENWAGASDAGPRILPPREPWVIDLNKDSLSLEVPAFGELGDSASYRVIVEVSGYLIDRQNQVMPTRTRKGGRFPAATDLAYQTRRGQR